MTTPNGNILFNSSTGSDAAASGLGPTTAVTGTGGSTNGTTTVNLSVDTPNLSGVSAGDLIWVKSSSGRQFSIIASVDDVADTVTCDDIFSNTESSLIWAIGGTRQTLDNSDSRTLFGTDGWTSEWVVELADNQSITSSLALGASGTITGGGTVRTITQSANDSCLDLGATSLRPTLRWLKLENTNVTKTSAHGFNINFASGSLNAYRCVFGDSTNTLNVGIQRGTGTPSRPLLVHCEIGFCTGDGLNIVSNTSITLHNCFIHDNGGDGIAIGRASNGIIIGNIFANNTGIGFHDSLGSSSIGPSLIDNRFYNNGSHGADISSGSPSIYSGNIFTENGGYGIQSAEPDINIFNVFGFGSIANTSGSTNGGMSTGDNTITLTVDPYVNAAGNDFNINSNSAGGNLLRTTNTAIQGS